MKIILYTALFIASALAAPAQSPGITWGNATGDSGTDAGYAVATDAAGNIYATGTFEGTVDFDPGPGTYTLTSAGFHSIFIYKLDPSGNLLWAKGCGNAAVFINKGYAITTDLNGNVLITGTFTGQVDFDPGPGIYNLTSQLYTGAFILKLNSAGDFVWAASMGDTGNVNGMAIKTDNSGNVYTAGYFMNPVDFDPGPGIYNLTAAGFTNADIFISKLDSMGNFVWADAMGGYGEDELFNMDIDADANIYITGYFSGTADFNPDTTTAFNLTVNGQQDAFIAKYNAAGQFIWAKQIGGTQSDYGYSIKLDDKADIYTAGFFRDTADADPGPGIYNLAMPAGGFGSYYICRYDSSGNFINAGVLPDAYSMAPGISLALDNKKNIYVGGTYAGTADLDPDTASHYYLSSSMISGDVFLAKLDSAVKFIWAEGVGGTGNDFFHDMILDAGNNIYITGEYLSDTLTLGAATFINSNNDGIHSDIFIARIGICSAHFELFADTTPHNWIALNQCTGVLPLTFQWNWGDSTTSASATPVHVYSDTGYYDVCVTIMDAAGCISSYCDSSAYLYRTNGMVTLNVVLNLTDINEDALQVPDAVAYPNPSHNIVYFKNMQHAERFEVYNSTGIKVMEKLIDEQAQQTLDLSLFSPGIYIVKVYAADTIATARIVKQ
jgi:hypothetical protein